MQIPTSKVNEAVDLKADGMGSKSKTFLGLGSAIKINHGANNNKSPSGPFSK